MVVLAMVSWSLLLVGELLCFPCVYEADMYSSNDGVGLAKEIGGRRRGCGRSP